jgi:hypothetical protein
MVGKVRDWYVVSRYIQGCSPCLCWLRTDGLAPVSKYWTYWSNAGVYGPRKPSSHHQQMLDFAPTTSLVGSGEKLGMDPRIGQLACCELCREPFFSGAVALLNSVDDYIKCCYMRTMWDTYGPGPYANWTLEAWDMLVRFSPAGCTSIRITATLGYE